jgi:DNA-binding response OmpR family regulator
MLLEHLVKREMLSLSSVMALLQSNNATSRVFISRLRQKTGLSIRNYRGEGYALRPESRKALISHIKGEPIK